MIPNRTLLKRSRIDLPMARIGPPPRLEGSEEACGVSTPVEGVVMRLAVQRSCGVEYLHVRAQERNASAWFPYDLQTSLPVEARLEIPE